MKIALIGNPNCGKTTLFNLLTGAKQRVGNWPGVTVERKTGIFCYQNTKYNIIDLPGTYSIENDPLSVSQDELIAREFVLTEKNSLIINVIDATNLQRSLYLTMQLIDLQVPMLVVLNMIDAVKSMGEVINQQTLAHLLGCPVVSMSASKKIGINTLYQHISQATLKLSIAKPAIDTLGTEQSAVIDRYIKQLPVDSQMRKFNRWQIIDALLDDSHYLFNQLEIEKLNACRILLATCYDNEIDVALACARYETIDQVCHKVIAKPREISDSVSEKLDKITLGRVTGIPLFLLIMYAMFMVAINFGSVFIDFFDVLCGTIFVDGLSHVLQLLNTPDWLRVILANGIGSGLQTVSTFIPVIAMLFLCLSFLEDSGYLARAAMVVDRVMRCIGLPGKAFVPMLVGFGCGVPAIMGTRTLESSRDRIMTICMIPFMSCSARLPVYTLFAVIFFPRHASMVVFGLYLLGILLAVITGFILKITLLKGPLTPFIMEMPVYRIPTLTNMLKLTWQRLKSFIFRAGKAIVLMVTLLSVLNSWGTDGSFGHENSDNSVLAVVSQKITPVFGPIGINQHNWPATVGIFTGIFAKESVIATLNSLYSMGDGQPSQQFSLTKGVLNALTTIPNNLVSLADSVLDPLGLATVDDNIATLQSDLAIDSTTIAQIKISFITPAAALAYLIFILLYTPCAAALGTIYREAGYKWMLFVAVWAFSVAWLTATIYYQLTLLSHSRSAGYWLIICAILIALMLGLVRLLARHSLFEQSIIKQNLEPTKPKCCD
ncbi:ferrous iron transport protein B [Gilliamella sp. wkB178]|uniref:Fe(2+) transporter permease subunit FeoB n=1 Tax=Gilliamella sp. wkB178 TaxID=3120259 RepID=UPI00080E6B23|nr:Fe(2+) transporter permease subunit FeoB [Gilliamella apicola]OCG07928.1 ferrous iron transport protein B [Gilliamella apicola]